MGAEPREFLLAERGATDVHGCRTIVSIGESLSFLLSKLQYARRAFVQKPKVFRCKFAKISSDRNAAKCKVFRFEMRKLVAWGKESGTQG